MPVSAASISTTVEIVNVADLEVSACPVPTRTHEDRVLLRLRLGSTEVSIVGTREDVWALLDTWTGQVDEIEDDDLTHG